MQPASGARLRLGQLPAATKNTCQAREPRWSDGRLSRADIVVRRRLASSGWRIKLNTLIEPAASKASRLDVAVEKSLAGKQKCPRCCPVRCFTLRLCALLSDQTAKSMRLALKMCHLSGRRDSLVSRATDQNHATLGSIIRSELGFPQNCVTSGFPFLEHTPKIGLISARARVGRL